MNISDNDIRECIDKAFEAGKKYAQKKAIKYLRKFFKEIGNGCVMWSEEQKKVFINDLKNYMK